MVDGRPTSRYQCVSRPGACKFEWCCGPECACVLKTPAGTEQEKADEKTARKMQAKWRRSIAKAKVRAYKLTKAQLEQSAWIEALADVRCLCLKIRDMEGFEFFRLWLKAVLR